jgi:serine/threonine-protein kinase
VTAGSDLYSIGVILYELLTGEVPFAADSAVAVALKQVSEMPRPPSELNPAVPRALDAAVMRALAKDPANRFASADEFEAALDAAERDPSTAPFETAVFGMPPVAPPDAAEAREADGRPPPPEEPPAEEGKRHRWRWVIVGALLLGLVALAVWALTRPAQVTVPSVIGTDVEAATATLEDEDLEVDVTEFPSQTSKAGSVIEQDPRAGEQAEEGSTVVLSVSSGPGVARVPEVAGLEEAEATDELEDAGFRVNPEERFSDEFAAGVAIGTEPGEGTKLKQNQVVTLLVSKGSNVVEVPSVLGLAQDDAEAELDEAGFIVNVDTEESEQPEGTVFAQDPGPGPAERGSTVTITVSTGIAQVSIESVIGDTKQAARATLRAQGLKVSMQKQDVDTENDDGIVIDQFPSGGEQVDPGSTVTIVVGKFKPSGTGFPDGE